MSSCRQHLSGVDGRRLVHREDSEGLVPLGALHAFAHQTGAFVGGLIAVASQHRHVQKNIGPPIVWYDETVSLRGIKPFDHAGDLDESFAETRERIDRSSA
jgi:hypothetical protein